MGRAFVRKPSCHSIRQFELIPTSGCSLPKDSPSPRGSISQWLATRQNLTEPRDWLGDGVGDEPWTAAFRDGSSSGTAIGSGPTGAGGSAVAAGTAGGTCSIIGGNPTASLVGWPGA